MKRELEDDDPEPVPKRQRKNAIQLQADHILDPDLFADDKSSLYSGTENSCASNALPTETSPTPLTAGSPNPHARRKFPSDLKTIKCPSCPKTFNRPARLAAHLRSHTNDRPFKCTFGGCTKDYLEEKHLKQHIKGSHTQERRYACPEAGCGKAFVTATRLRRHAAVHEGAERYRCRGHGACDQSFRKHQTLQRHVRTEHLGQAAYACPDDACPAGFDTAGALKRHVDREHGELRFWCDECGTQRVPEGDGGGDDDDDTVPAGRVGFTTMALLQAHMRREHVNCMFCSVRCGSQAQLERHVETHHSGSTVSDRKTIACGWAGCPKTFTKRNNLAAHVRTAHEGFRFVCGEVDTFGTHDIADWNWLEEGCGEGFISKLKLEEHVRFVHLGRRRPPRPLAVGGGAQPGDDEDLIEALSGVVADAKRNIPCSVAGCLARFIRYHDLRTHVKHAHDGQEEEEEGQVAPAEDFPSSHAPHQTSVVVGDMEAVVPGDEFWFAAGADDEHGRGEFEREWADMRRLIDVDALTD